MPGLRQQACNRLDEAGRTADITRRVKVGGKCRRREKGGADSFGFGWPVVRRRTRVRVRYPDSVLAEALQFVRVVDRLRRAHGIEQTKRRVTSYRVARAKHRH